MKELMFSNLTYEIKEENYDKSKERAIVKVTISNVNYIEIMSDAYQIITSIPENSNISTDQLNKKIVKKAMQLLKEVNKKTQTVNVLLEKNKTGDFQMIEDNVSFHMAITGQAIK